jgi:hypothetical protein
MSLAAMTWQTLTSVGGAAAEDSVAVLRIRVPLANPRLFTAASSAASWGAVTHLFPSHA